MTQKINAKFPWIMTLCALSGVVILIGLGLWQLQRLEWKQRLISELKTTFAKDPTEFFDASKAYDPYTLTLLKGEVLAKSAFIQSKIYDEAYPTYHPVTEKLGKHLIMPMETDSGVIFVNLGWVPTDFEAFNFGFNVNVEDQFRVVLKPATRSNPFVPDNDATKASFYWSEIPALEAFFELKSASPYIAWAIAWEHDLEAPPYPMGGMPDLRNDHAQYAAFWFFMSFVLSVIYLLKLRQTLKK